MFYKLKYLDQAGKNLLLELLLDGEEYIRIPFRDEAGKDDLWRWYELEKYDFVKIEEADKELKIHPLYQVNKRRKIIKRLLFKNLDDVFGKLNHPDGEEIVKFVQWFHDNVRRKINVKIFFSEIYEYAEVVVWCMKKYPLKRIKKIVHWAVNDPFWKVNFLSLRKLKRVNKEGIAYIDVLEIRYKQSLDSSVPEVLDKYRYDEV